MSCLAFKNPKQWAKAKLGNNIKCSAPWELVCIDLQGKWPTTSKGYKYTCTVICGFSKFVLIIQLKSKKAEHIAKKLWKRVFSNRLSQQHTTLKVMHMQNTFTNSSTLL